MGWLFPVALKHALYFLSFHLSCEEADEPDHGEAAQHGNGTAVDGVDWIAEQHVNDRQAYAPNEAGPYAGRRDTAPVEAQHERRKEGKSGGKPVQ